jgi:hypothetical protein
MKAAFLSCLALAFAGCASFHIPIGTDEKYGSVDVTARYNPPAQAVEWANAHVSQVENDFKAVR